MAEVDIDLHELGGRVLSVFGPFGSSTMIMLPTEIAQQMFPDGLATSGRTEVIDAAERDIDAIRTTDPALAGSALAAAAVALAYEIANPYNSATSKSMCVRELREVTDRLRELAPPKREADEVDEIAKQRAKRRAADLGGAAT